jgi:hypothetical protein
MQEAREPVACLRRPEKERQDKILEKKVAGEANEDFCEPIGIKKNGDPLVLLGATAAESQ